MTREQSWLGLTYKFTPDEVEVFVLSWLKILWRLNFIFLLLVLPFIISTVNVDGRNSKNHTIANTCIMIKMKNIVSYLF